MLPFPIFQKSNKDPDPWQETEPSLLQAPLHFAPPQSIKTLKILTLLAFFTYTLILTYLLNRRELYWLCKRTVFCLIRIIVCVCINVLCLCGFAFYFSIKKTRPGFLSTL